MYRVWGDPLRMLSGSENVECLLMCPYHLNKSCQFSNCLKKSDEKQLPKPNFKSMVFTFIFSKVPATLSTCLRYTMVLTIELAGEISKGVILEFIGIINVHTHTCTHARMHTNKHTNTRTYAHTHARTRTRAHGNTHAHTHARTHANTHINKHTHAHACTHTHTHTHTHARTHARTHAHWWHSASLWSS